MHSTVRLPILMYHHVGPIFPGMNARLNVSPEQFLRQMRWLKSAGYTAIGTREWLDHVSGARVICRKPVMITFDDGFLDLDQYAFPILLAVGMKAVVFVVSGYMGAVNAWDASYGFATQPLLDEARIRRWHEAGMEIGAHSRTHPELPRIAPERQLNEICGSSNDIEKMLGAPPAAFAYPYGECNHNVLRLTEAHYDCAVTSLEGLNDVETPLRRLRRTMVQPYDSLADFAARVRLGWSPVERLRRRVWRAKERLRRIGG